MVDIDELIVRAYWAIVIAPELRGVPKDIVRQLRDAYVRDVLANPAALEQAREWLQGYE